MAMRALRSLSLPPQVVHFIPMQATPRPAMETMMPTIIRARVAWSEPGAEEEKERQQKTMKQRKCKGTVCCWEPENK